MRTALALTVLLLVCPTLAARQSPTPPETGVLGIRLDQLGADYWVQHNKAVQREVLPRAAITQQNTRLLREDKSMHQLDALPAQLPAAQVRAWIDKLAPSFERPLFDERGQPLDMAPLAKATQTALQRETLAETVTPRFALVVHRADLRAVPNTLRVFRSADDHDIDRWQESALFPGTPVAIVHESVDGQWAFVVSPNYAAWTEKRYLAEGSRAQVLAYGRDKPSVVITGAQVRTTYTPEDPRVSNLQLDMGLRLPLQPWPLHEAVNGQDPYASYVLELPVRDAQGKLAFAPALLARSADVAADYLPLTQGNLIRQGFKFLGERYGWGNSYGARDCSSFVSEVYRSMGVNLPRNTSDQAISPVFNRLGFDKDTPRALRLQAVKASQPGDLIYIPGHVMMVIGHDRGQTWVIHDTSGSTWLDTDGKRIRSKLNGVAVTPLEPLLFNESETYVDRITSIQRIRHL